MPIRFQAISDTKETSKVFAGILGTIFEQANSGFATSDKKYFIVRSEMIDVKTKKVLGHYVYTLHTNEEKQVNEVLDVDIILSTAPPCKLHFLKLLSGSSDSNEYYEVETADTAQHLSIETVCRYAIDGELLGTEQEAYISIFPYQLTVYKNLDDFNRKMGVSNVKVGDTDLTVSGFSETFCSPSSTFDTAEDDEPGSASSFILGTVKAIHKACICIDKNKFKFIIADVETALGTVPVAMNKGYFDLRKLRVGSFLGMCANVKADLSTPEIFLR